MVKQTKKQSINQVWLSVLFMIVILGNFVTVAGISYYYESNGADTKTLLWETDSDSEYLHFTTTDNYVQYPYLNVTTGIRWIETGNIIAEKVELTPAYLGNGTWGVSCPTLGNNPYDWVSGVVVVAVPNMHNYLITNIFINYTMPDNDVHWGITALHTDSTIFGLTDYGSADPQSQETNIIPPSSNAVTVDDYVLAYDVPLAKSLAIFDDSRDKSFTALEMGWNIDDPSVGMVGFASQWNVQIYGEQITGWSLQDSLTVSVTLWNIIIGLAIVYSLDVIDLGGFVKTIRKGRN